MYLDAPSREQEMSGAAGSSIAPPWRFAATVQSRFLNAASSCAFTPAGNEAAAGVETFFPDFDVVVVVALEVAAVAAFPAPTARTWRNRN